MGLMGLNLIEIVCGLILFLRSSGLILEVRVEARNIGNFGFLGRPRRTTRGLKKSPLITFYVMILMSLNL